MVGSREAMPDVSHLRIWGCTAYVHVQKDKRAALGSHMEKCIFIGYPEGYKGWKFYNPITKKLVISERAEFDERYMLGSHSVQRPQETRNDTSNDEQRYIPIPAIQVDADDDEDDDSIRVPLAEPQEQQQQEQQEEQQKREENNNEDVQPEIEAEVDERPVTPPPPSASCPLTPICVRFSHGFCCTFSGLPPHLRRSTASGWPCHLKGALYTKPRVYAGVQWTPGTLCGVRWTPGSVQANLVTTKNSVKMGMESMWIPHRLQTKCLDFPWIPEDWSQCGLMWTPWTPHSICIHA